MINPIKPNIGLWISSEPGLVLIRFDRFFLIGTHAEKGPALRLLTNASLRFQSKLLVYSAGAGPSVFKVFRETKPILKLFPTVSENAV